jgi:predicted DNA-binding transcriptional regulator AlpA
VSGRLLTARELAARLGVSTGALLRWTRAGKVPSARKLPSGAIRYDPEETEVWLAGLKMAGSAPEEVSPAPDAARQPGVSFDGSPVPLRPVADHTQEDHHARP